MSTPSATVAPTVTVTSTPALNKSVSELCDAQVKIEGKFHGTADALRQGATSRGYDRKQSGQMLEAAYITTAEQMFKHLKGEELAKEISSFVSRKAPDRSKILSLAYPATEAAATAVTAAKEHNRTAPASEKIGVNDLLKIARDKDGKTTVESILAEREANRTRGAQNGGAPRIPGQPAPAASTTPTVWDRETAKKALMDTYTSLRTIGKLTAEQADDLIAEVVTEFAEATKAD